MREEDYSYTPEEYDEVCAERDAIERNFLAVETEAQQLRGEVDRLQEVLERARELIPEGLVMMNTPSTWHRWVEELAAALSPPPQEDKCPEPGCVYVDLTFFGTHPGWGHYIFRDGEPVHECSRHPQEDEDGDA